MYLYLNIFLHTHPPTVILYQQQMYSCELPQQRGERVGEWTNITTDLGIMEKLFTDPLYDLTLQQARAPYQLLDHIARQLHIDHGLFYLEVMRKRRDDDRAVFETMNIDVTHKDGKSLATVKCCVCSSIIGHDSKRWIALDHGPDYHDQCDPCYIKSPYSPMMAPDVMNRLHVRNSVAGPTTAVSLCNAFRLFAHRPFIGRRLETTDTNGHITYGEYQWTKLSTAQQHSFAVACASRPLLPRQSFVGICGPNRSVMYFIFLYPPIGC
jgi:hypothetical protein